LAISLKQQTKSSCSRIHYLISIDPFKSTVIRDVTALRQSDGHCTAAATALYQWQQLPATTATATATTATESVTATAAVAEQCFSAGQWYQYGQSNGTTKLVFSHSGPAADRCQTFDWWVGGA